MRGRDHGWRYGRLEAKPRSVDGGQRGISLVDGRTWDRFIDLEVHKNQM